MKNLALLAVLETELATLKGQREALVIFTPEHDLVPALDTRINATSLAVTAIKKQVTTVENTSEEDMIASVLNEQQLLESVILSNLAVGTKEKRVMYQFVYNMMKLRKSPMTVNELKAYFEPKGYVLKNWSDFFYQMRKEYPQVRNVAKGQYAIVEDLVKSEAPVVENAAIKGTTI